MKLSVQFNSFELEETDSRVEFTAKALEPGNFNGVEITLDEIEKSAQSWIGKDVLWGHSDLIIGEITHSEVKEKTLIHRGIIEDSRAVKLIQSGKLKPSIGASAEFERKDGVLMAQNIQGDHLALVRRPACKQCSVSVAMSEHEALELVYKTASELPDSVKSALPAAAQTIFMKAYNSAMTSSCKNASDMEACCNKVAWAAVKNAGYQKQGDKWVKMEEQSDNIEFKEWDTRYINDLPDSAFAYVEPCYKRGDTDNKNARHLPYKDKNGNVDLPHLRNALARVDQIKPICSDTNKNTMIQQARGTLTKAAKQHLKSYKAHSVEEQFLLQLSIDFIKSFHENTLTMTDEHEHNVKLEAAEKKALALEEELKELRVKLEAAEKEIEKYRTRERVEMAGKVADAEIKLGKTAEDKKSSRVEELSKLEMTELKEQYVVLLEEIAAKAQKGQTRVPAGSDAEQVSLEKKLEQEIIEMQNKMNNMVVV